MKILILFSLLLSGCSSVGLLLKGAGDGLSGVARQPVEQQAFNCTETYQVGNAQNYRCQ